MLKYWERLDRIFHALADSSRRTMVERLVRSPASVSELGRPLDMSMSAVVQHLGVLESAGIVTSEKVGRVRTYQLAPEALTPVAEWIGKQRLPAERRLDRLGELLDRETTGETAHDPSRTPDGAIDPTGTGATTDPHSSKE